MKRVVGLPGDTIRLEDGYLYVKEAGQDEDDNQEPVEETPSAVFMVFDSGGTLRYDARVVNGEVVDSYGNPIAGCYVNEAGNVKDAYWNEIDPRTGELIQP